MRVEYMHLTNDEQQDWIRNHFEAPEVTELPPKQKKVLFERLIRSTKFEDFLAKKWPSEKRFGLEGCEVLVPAIEQVIDRSHELGVNSIVLGMPHRGRLNVLANVCQQPLSTILALFNTMDEGSRDVKYHLGVCIERLNRQSQRMIKIALVANSSYLEAVNPVVQGKVRAEAFYSNDLHCDRHMALVLHGDASFCGQGVVMETFNLKDLPHYSINGTIHIVVNNQIGFTTDPRASRSSRYCTDVGRAMGIPIFHVNADDPEAVMHVCDVAAQWRKEFKKDVIIDLVCYRRHGHNELDEPLLDQYQEKILAEGIDQEYVNEELKKYGAILEKAHESAKQVTELRNRDWLDSPWDDGKIPSQLLPTGIERDSLEHIVNKISEEPKGFNLYPRLLRLLKGRKEMLSENNLDWSIGESLAFGSLLKEGIHVRLSGQDVERGTFHRHHVLHDQKIDQKTYNPLNDLSETQAEYTVCNSPLTKYAVLAFEYGYSVVNPNSLVIWEAQFGDFANTAQPVIDQFISSGESKWGRKTNLTLLLPHGYEGMGPEHSSARPERFLQMCNEDDDIDLKSVNLDEAFVARQLNETNWIVANCTTPANFFHLLRRQIHSPFRKPLIVFTPKRLLIDPLVRSPVDDFLPGTSFRRAIPEEGSASNNPAGVERLVFCSGKVYYDILTERRKQGLEDKVAVVRLEQLSPFPYDILVSECNKYSNAKVIWAQEEHKNMGAWTFVQPRFLSLLKRQRRGLTYAGRARSASPATGNKYTHGRETVEMMDAILKKPINNEDD